MLPPFSDFFPEVAASTDEGDVEFVRLPLDEEGRHEIQVEPDALSSQQLVSHLNDLEPDVQRFLLWAALFGGVFRIRDIISLIDSEETSGDDSEDDQQMRLSRGSMNGLQTALAEGWVINRGRDVSLIYCLRSREEKRSSSLSSLFPFEMCAFTHDRYRQAAFNLGDLLPAEEIQGMALKVRS